MALLILLLGCLMGTANADIGFTSLVAPASVSFPRNTEGSIVELRDGRLLLAWTQFYGGTRDESGAIIAGKTSSDGGNTWSKAYLIQENTGKRNVMSASLLRMKSGRLALYYLEKNSNSDLHLYARYSSDEAKTWSASSKVTLDPGYNIVNNDRVVQLSSGRLIVPVSYASDIGKRDPLVSFVVYSDDEGRIWRRSPSVLHAPDRGAMEPGVVELADGRLLMIIRTRVGSIYRSFSSDGGVTWEEARPTTVVSPEAPATIKRIPGSKDLLLVWNSENRADRAWALKRSPISAAISRDNGETWEYAKHLDTDPERGYAYTSMLFVKDRVLLTYYESDEKWDTLALRFRSIPLAWFYQPG